MDDEEVVICLSFLLLKRRFRRKNQQKKKKKRSQWVRPIYQRREENGLFHTLVQEMALGDREFYLK